MSASPEVIQVVRQWVARAEEDLVNAEHTLTMEENCPVSTVCFHAQQCAEKYLKALLTLHAVLFPKTHDLPELLTRVHQHCGVDLQPSDVSGINRYAVEGRYPGDWEPITRTEAEEAVAKARIVRERIRAHLPSAALP